MPRMAHVIYFLLHVYQIVLVWEPVCKRKIKPILFSPYQYHCDWTNIAVLWLNSHCFGVKLGFNQTFLIASPWSEKYVKECYNHQKWKYNLSQTLPCSCVYEVIINMSQNLYMFHSGEFCAVLSLVMGIGFLPFLLVLGRLCIALEPVWLWRCRCASDPVGKYMETRDCGF